MATSAGGIEYDELENSPTSEASWQGVSATRVFKVAWADIERFRNELMGLGRDVAGQVDVAAPLQFPGDRPNLLVDRVRVEPFDPTSPSGTALGALDLSANTYSNGARVTVTYTEKYDDGSGSGGSSSISLPQGTFLSVQGDGDVEYFTIPGRHWIWETLGTNVSDDQAAGLVVPIARHILTWHRVVRPPWSAMRTRLGCINSAAFWGADAETLLLSKYSYRREFGINLADPFWAVTYHFSEKRHYLSNNTSVVGWNYLFNKQASAGEHWQKIRTADAPVQYPYVSKTFADLFAYE